MEVKIVKQLTVKHFISFDASNAECHRFYQQAVGLLAICCTGPGTFATQIYFMFISIVAFLGAILLCLLHFKFFNFNRHGKCIVSANQLNHEVTLIFCITFKEFAYTATMGFFYLTAWVAQFCDLGPWEQPDYSHRWGAQIAAGVKSFHLFRRCGDYIGGVVKLTRLLGLSKAGLFF